jgi:CO dehydrogenase/acetyl-CoA synthase delta subunit
MPRYTLKNTETGEIYDVDMKIAEKEEHLKENPHLTQLLLKFPGVVDSVRIGVTKTDAGFRDVLHKVKSAHKHSTIEI